jgi:hypothetical protein
MSLLFLNNAGYASNVSINNSTLTLNLQIRINISNINNTKKIIFYKKYKKLYYYLKIQATLVRDFV